MIPELPVDTDLIKGFLAPDEAQALYEHALQACIAAPVLEVGSYCGKSTVCLGLACQRMGSLTVTLRKPIRWVKAGLKTAVLGYNRDDVIATRRLEEWLRYTFI